VITIKEDRSGNLWVGTYDQGLLRFDRRTGQVKTYRHNPSDPYSLSNDVVTRLVVDHNGTLWAATWDGLDRFDAATERFTSYKPEPKSKTLYYLELAKGPDGALWLGSHSSGLHRFDPTTGQFTIYPHDINRPGTLSENWESTHAARSGPGPSSMTRRCSRAPHRAALGSDGSNLSRPSERVPFSLGCSNGSISQDDSDFWCELMHDQPTWPICGSYYCRRCWRNLHGALGQCDPPQRSGPASAGQTEYARMHC